VKIRFVTSHIEKPNCYVASPYGFAESTREWYNTRLLPILDKYVTILDPWTVDVSNILDAPADKKADRWTDLGEYHYDTIALHAKLMVACLDQEPPDNGTVCEVAWAAAHKIPVIGYRGDLRTTGEENMPYNLMIAAAIRRSGGVAVKDMHELEKAFRHYGAQALTK
jgi:nucleoside 2-deoxyribosyltransferase